jgi:hypothetical protein
MHRVLRPAGMLLPMLLAISATTNNQRGPRFMEHALAALHQTSGTRLPITLVFEVAHLAALVRAGRSSGHQSLLRRARGAQNLLELP